MELPQCKASEALRRCRESLCAKFARVTGMDQAAARCILEGNQWLLEVVPFPMSCELHGECACRDPAAQEHNKARQQRYFHGHH